MLSSKLVGKGDNSTGFTYMIPRANETEDPLLDAPASVYRQDVVTSDADITLRFVHSETNIHVTVLSKILSTVSLLLGELGTSKCFDDLVKIGTL